MNGRDRAWVAVLLASAVLAALLVVVVASQACPGSTATNPCPEAPVNRAIVIGLAASSVGLVVTALAWLAAFRRRRIAYRGSWAVAIRRGILAGSIVAALAGLRLGDALNALSVVVVIAVAAAIEWAFLRAERQ